MPKRRPYKPRLVKPYLFPECPIQYAQCLYQGEGSHHCVIDHKRRRARLETKIEMKDREALQPLEPCFGTTVTMKDPARGTYELRRVGRAAVAIAQALSITTDRKQQILKARKECEEAWQKGYGDRIP